MTKNKLKLPLVVIILVLVSFFFYAFRLQETQLFINDTVRDTLRVLRLWQEKELTLIGASASFSEKTAQELYFGSFYLYTALAGMLVSGFSPLGAVLPNTFLYLFSIPVFYFLANRYFKNKNHALISAALYALSPVTVTHARFFWNPNLLIPLSVFFWYLATTPVKSRHLSLSFFFAGLLAAIMFNFHYFSLIPVAVYGIYLLVVKRSDEFCYLLLGFFLGSLPFLIFELKNHFYLTNAFFYNLNHGIRGLAHPFSFYLSGFFNIFLSVFGLAHGEIAFPIIFSNSYIPFILCLIVFFLIVYYFVRRRHTGSVWLWLCLFSTIGFTLYFSTYDLYLRYLFAAYPLIILFLVDLVRDLKYSRFVVILAIPLLFSVIKIISAQVSLANTDYISLPQIEAISQAIVADNPQGKYNVTENIHGDARATAFRYFLLRDAQVKPQDETSYGDLDTLYVISPSLEKTEKDNRWEYSASGPKEVVSTTQFDEVTLYKLRTTSSH